jgi:branched-chain amino acid transport system permease protein
VAPARAQTPTPTRVSTRGHLFRSMLTPVSLAVAVALLSLIVGGFNATLKDATIIGLINLTLVVALYVFVGNSGIFSFGHSAFMLVGAYVTGLLTIPAANKGFVLTSLPHWLADLTLAPLPAMLIALVVSAAVAFLFAIPLARMAALTAGLGTFAVLNIVYNVANNWNGVTGGSTGLASVPTTTTIGTALLVTVIAIFLAWAFQETALCLRLRATREDEVAARSLGIRVGPERVVSLIFSAVIGAMAGAVYAQYVGTFSPTAFYLSINFTVVAMLVVGGRASLTGAVTGSVLITALSYVLSQLQDGFSIGSLHVGARPGLEDLGVALVTLLCLILRPRGLTGGFEVADLLRKRGPSDVDPMRDALITQKVEAHIGTAARAPDAPAQSSDAITVDGVSVQFGGLRALSDVSLTLNSGEIVGLIGPNGAGKTTLLNVLTGYQRPTSGTVKLGSHDVTRLATERRARRGVIRSFQGARLFPRLTVAENVETSCVAQGMSRRAARKTGRELLHKFGLESLADVRAEALTSGQQRLLGVVRGLAAKPRYLLLDEPAAGLNESETDELAALLRTLPEEFGLGLLIVEHDMRLIFEICPRIHVLSEGHTIAEGAPGLVRSHPEVIRSYLGGFDDSGT